MPSLIGAHPWAGGGSTVAQRQRRVAFLLLAPAVLVLAALAVYPLVFSATLSFRLDPLYNPKVAKFIGWRNYGDLWEDIRFWESIGRTVYWSVVVVTVQMVLGLLLAVLLDRHMRGAGLLRSLIIIPVFISPVAMGLTWRFIFEPVSGLANWILNSGLGLSKYTWLSHKDTALSTLMIVDCWQWTPFVALILLAGMQSISTEVTEAARLDRVRGVTYYTRIVLPYFKMANFAGIIDSKTVLVIVYVAFGLPFAVWILRGFLLDLPKEVEEAARLDGLGWLQIIFRLILPMAAPGIAVTTIFTFVFSWNEFLFAVFLTYDKAQTMPVALQKTIDVYNVLWGSLSAGAVIQLLPMVLVVFLLQRHIARGLALGAVK